MKWSFWAALSLSFFNLCLSQTTYACGLDSILKSESRQSSSARDKYRNPAETLAFFDIKPTDSVVEIWPGDGWYAEILAPFLKHAGTYRAAHFDPESSVEYFRLSRSRFEKRIANEASLFDNTIMTTFAPPTQLSIAPQESVDKILTFRNAHNWYMRGAGEKTLLAAFKGFYNTLKPGGTLGVVDHRLPESRADSEQDQSGYMKQSYIIAIAEKAGFTLQAKSDINSNPRDTAHHPNGVWSLLPRLRVNDTLKAQYQKIGESDRMTLKFIKPLEDHKTNND